MTTIVSIRDAANSGSYAGRSHAEYKRARAHSRLVRVLKILLPLASAAAFTVVGFVPCPGSMASGARRRRRSNRW
jgi:lipopolysaccharide export system protein LptC